VLSGGLTSSDLFDHHGSDIPCSSSIICRSSVQQYGSLRVRRLFNLMLYKSSTTSHVIVVINLPSCWVDQASPSTIGHLFPIAHHCASVKFDFNLESFDSNRGLCGLVTS